MLQFCWPLWFAGLASLYIASSSRLFLRVFASLGEVGLLELGTKFAAIVGVLIWTPFSQHWEAVSYKYHQDGTAPLMFQTAFLVVSTLLVVAGLGVSIFATPVIGVMSDPAFHDAARTVGLLTLGFVFSNLWTFFTFSFMVTDRTRVASAGYYLAGALITVLFVALIPAWGAVGAAAAQCLAYGATFLVFHRLSRRFFDPGIRLRPFAVTLVIAAATYMACERLPGQEGALAGIAADMVLYLVGCAFITTIAGRTLKVLNGELYGSACQSFSLWLGKAVGTTRHTGSEAR
jgi:O-antigen/teichoic acid export membrane protein